MIKYRLVCKNCNFFFDSWFSSSIEYEKLKKKKYLNCHQCNSNKVEKSLMAPKMLTKQKENNIDKENKNFKEIKKTIIEYQKFVKKNFDYVGKNFAFEARSIHYDKKNKKKGIFGTASAKEINELKEEGIETNTIPWIEDKNN